MNELAPLAPSISLAVLGSINVDLTIRSQRIPAIGETVVGGSFYRAHGGKGANQAVAAVRYLQGHVSLIGGVGDDAFGRLMIQDLQSDGIDASEVYLHPSEATGTALILVDAQGNNCISVASGANNCVTADEIQTISAAFWQRHPVALASLEVPLLAVHQFLRMGREHGQQTILNPAPIPMNQAQLLSDTLSYVDVLTPNETEALWLQNCLPELNQESQSGSITEIAVRIADHFACHCILTCGGNGAYWAAPGSTLRHFPAHAVRAVDTTAAGDAFSGVLSAAILEGQPMEDAIPTAMAAAACSVQKEGAQSSLPNRTEVLTQLAELNEK